MMNHRASLAILVVAYASIQGIYAGPAPYASIRIFVVDHADAVIAENAEELRDNARLIVSLTDVRAAEFWRDVDWPERMKIDESISSSEDKIYMIVDCYRRTEPHFTGEPDTLLCTRERAYNPESGRYISTSDLVDILLEHLTTIKPK